MIAMETLINLKTERGERVSKKEWVEVIVDDVTIEREKAICCLIYTDGASIEKWIPKSQIHEYSEVKEFGDSGVLLVPEWLAMEKRLI